MLEGLAAVDQMRLPPEGAGTVRALSRIGYELPAALADLIDNSIDAGARQVEITFLRNDREITAVTIADDGRGMNAAAMRVGMQFAGRTDHEQDRLGAFGMGLKSASFSQGRTLIVVSRQAGATIASRWSVEAIGKDWRCDVLDPKGAAAAFDKFCMRGRTPASGTLVIWERLDRLAVGTGADALDEFLNTALPRLEAHLGLVFHRFIQQGVLTISLVVRHEKRTLALPRKVKPRDPFGYPNSGVSGWPKVLRTSLPNLGRLELEAHIWPGGSAADEFLLGSRKGLEFQGFYFYRNNRLIQAGGWNGVVKNNQEPDLLQARVAVELPPGGLDVNVQKSALQITAAQTQAFLRATDGKTNFEKFLEVARATYRAERRARASYVTALPVPGPGMPASVRRSSKKRLIKLAQVKRNNPVEEIAFVWGKLDENQVFDLDLTEVRIILNRNYRRAILGGSAASPADAPLVKMLLFLLLKDDFGRSRSSRKHREQLEAYNAILVDTLKNR